MKLLNKTSLYQTIDNVNEYLFYGNTISKKEAGDLIYWISSRLDTEYSYNKSFGVTSKDMKDKVFTFTGERLSSPASMRHIMAEETSRVLRQLSKITGKKVPAIMKSDKRLLMGVKATEAAGKPVGTFCCGPCTVGLWRNMAVGGLGSHSKKLTKGIEVLKKFRDGKGAWGRFPFYYTILALSEVNHPTAKNELNYAKDLINRKLNRINTKSKFSKRKRDLLMKVTGNN